MYWVRREEEKQLSYCSYLSICLALQANKIDGVIENNSKFEDRTVVQFLQAEVESESEIHRRLVSVYCKKVFN
jgi:hypothetical protein